MGHQDIWQVQCAAELLTAVYSCGIREYTACICPAPHGKEASASPVGNAAELGPILDEHISPCEQARCVACQVVEHALQLCGVLVQVKRDGFQQVPDVVQA